MTNYSEAEVARALAELESSHVQNNKHRMGALGAQNIDRAIVALRTASLGGDIEARAMFDAQNDKFGVPWDRQWEPTKEYWRKKAATPQTPEDAVLDRMDSAFKDGHAKGFKERTEVQELIKHGESIRAIEPFLLKRFKDALGME